MAYFPGNIYDFVFEYLIYTMVLPLIIGCLLAALGDRSGLGRLVSFFNLAAALYFPVWGIQLWTHINNDCESLASIITRERCVRTPEKCSEQVEHTVYDADLHNAGETAFNSAEYSNLYLVFQVEVVLSVLSGIGAVGDICRWPFSCPGA